MVISELIREASALMHDNSRFEAELIVMSVLNMNRTQLVTNLKTQVARDPADKVIALAKRRQNGEPLQYILGECEFMSLGFYVSSGVLIPRSDTETLVETVIGELKSMKGPKILDICTGSGCVGISLAHFLKDASVVMTDISDTAIHAARKNAVRNGVDDRVAVIKSDILSEIPDGGFDAVVSNPPYIRTGVIPSLSTEVKDHEPHIALDGGIDGITFYRRITVIAPDMLRDGGLLALEIGYDQAAEVSALMRGAFDNVKIIKDLSGNDRVVTGRKKHDGTVLV